MPTFIEAVQGDITKQDVDAIVNAANTSLLGGRRRRRDSPRRGVRQLLEACRKLGGCPTARRASPRASACAPATSSTPSARSGAAARAAKPPCCGSATTSHSPSRQTRSALDRLPVDQHRCLPLSVLLRRAHRRWIRRPRPRRIPLSRAAAADPLCLLQRRRSRRLRRRCSRPPARPQPRSRMSAPGKLVSSRSPSRCASKNSQACVSCSSTSMMRPSPRCFSTPDVRGMTRFGLSEPAAPPDVIKENSDRPRSASTSSVSPWTMSLKKFRCASCIVTSDGHRCRWSLRHRHGIGTQPRRCR